MSFFKPSEFDSPDQPGSGALMNANFLSALEHARGFCDFPWRVTAGYRTPAHNKAIGGATNSFHLKGQAADIACKDAGKRRAIVAAAIQAGIPGIEVCDAHVHLDWGPMRLWSDKSK